MVPGDCLSAFVDADAVGAERDVGTSQEHASVTTTKPHKLSNDAGAAAESVRARRRQAQVKDLEDGGSWKCTSTSSLQRRSSFLITKCAAGQAHIMAEGRCRKTEVNVHLVDSRQVWLQGGGMNSTLEQAQVQQHRGFGGWHGAERSESSFDLYLHTVAPAEKEKKRSNFPA